jgi:hypothetical protein
MNSKSIGNCGAVLGFLLLSALSAIAQVDLHVHGAVQSFRVGGGIVQSIPIQRETTEWQAAVLANGGIFNTVDTQAVDYFIRETKAKGIWPLLDWVALFAGQNLNAALVPVKRTVGDPVITNSNFTESDFSPLVGLTGNGSTKRLLPGLNRSQCRAGDDVSLGVYITGVQGAEILAGLIGTATSGNLHVFASSAQTSASARVNSNSAIAGSMFGSKIIGVVGASRVPSEAESFVFSQAGSVGSSQSTGISPSVITLFARSTTDFFGGSLGGGWFGGGMTAQQRADFTVIWNQTMAILGRPVSY